MTGYKLNGIVYERYYDDKDRYSTSVIGRTEEEVFAKAKELEDSISYASYGDFGLPYASRSVSWDKHPHKIKLTTKRVLVEST